MQMKEDTPIRRNSHADKWLTLDVMQRVEQVRCIAEMLDATMEDILDQMENLESVIDCLQEGTETIQEQIEELMDLIQTGIEEGHDISGISHEGILS